MELKNKQDINSNFKQASSIASSAIEVSNIVTIQCTTSAYPSQRQCCDCWRIVSRVLECTAIVAASEKLVEYPFTNLHPVENPILVLTKVCDEVCDRITHLWQAANLPASVQHLLATFYQRLDFSQENLNVLSAIESCVTQSSATHLDNEKGGFQTNTQNNLKAAGVDNQIARIIFATE